MLTDAEILDLQRKHNHLVRGIIHRFYSLREEMEDVEQDIWLAVSTSETPVAEMYARWISGVARNTCLRRLDHQRLRRAQQFDLPDHDPESEARVELEELGDLSGEIEDSRLAVIREAVKVLPDDLRELVIRYFYRNEPLKHVAAETGVAAPVLQRRLSEALDKIAFFLPSQPKAVRDRHRQTTGYSPRRASVRKRGLEEGVHATAGDASQTVFRERLPGGKWIFQHRQLDLVDEQAYREILAEERQELCSYPLSLPVESEAGTSIGSRRKPSSLPAVIEMLRHDHDLHPEQVRARFGFTRSYADRIIYLARKELGITGKSGRRKKAA